MDKNIVLGGQEFTVCEIKTNFGGIELEEPKLQMKLLDAYRLTDEYRRVYGEYVFAVASDGVRVKAAANAVKKFKNLDVVDIEEHKDLIVDLLYSRYVLGFLYWEYFGYDFEQVAIRDRLGYMSNQDIKRYYSAMNRNGPARRTVRNKYLSYKAFKPYYKRDLILISGEKDKEAFLQFCEKHQKMILKPVEGSLGKHVEIIDLNRDCTAEEAFQHVIDTGGSYVCEELIVQCDELSSFHPQSVNGMRVYSYNNGKEVRLLCPFLKTGRGSAIVDNGGAGGILAYVDVNTGIIVGDGRDELARDYEVHPDTGVRFKGFQIPMWVELVSIVKAAAAELPGVPMIGWDFAMSKEKGWQMIEANSRGQIFAAQIPARRGLKKEFEEIFEWNQWKKRIAEEN